MGRVEVDVYLNAIGWHVGVVVVGLVGAINWIC